MPKATLEYNLPDEEEEFKIATHGIKYYCSINEILEELRNKIKYEELSEAEHKIYEEIRSMIYNILDEYEVEKHF